jgi:hypothetical protein
MVMKSNVAIGIHPIYSVKVTSRGGEGLLVEVWQIPSSATPQASTRRRLAGLHGRTLSLIENRLLKQLRLLGVDAIGLPRGSVREFQIGEEDALRMGLLFRILAPMRSWSKILSCVTAIEAMGKEEAAYWLGMAMHRKHPRRVLTALRHLVTEPTRRS